MGNTIRAQNETLERVNAKQGSDIQRVGLAVQKAGELMKWDSSQIVFSGFITITIKTVECRL